MYTVHRDDGSRDLRIEHGLQALEDRFTRVRKTTFDRELWPPPEKLVDVLAFVAALQFRTVAIRDDSAEQWGRLRDMTDAMQDRLDQATLPEREAMARASAPLRSGRGRTMGPEQIRALAERPIQTMLPSAIATVLRMISKMSVSVLCTSDVVGFVTTDHPCVLFDPKGHTLPPIYRGVGLTNPRVELTVPLSPSHCLLISHRANLHGEFWALPPDSLDELNRRHIAHGNTSFVARENTTKPVWFRRYPLPDDAWEEVQARKAAAVGDEPEATV